MKAAFYCGIKDIRVEDVSIPEIDDNEILIKVKATAICGTDLRIYKFGHFKIPEGSKRVLGHEIAGEIVEIGKNVSRFSVGMRIVVPPNVGCGVCEMCRQGYNQLCYTYEAFGISWDGGFQEYMKVPAQAIKMGNLLPIPDSLSYNEAALCEPFSCCYNSYKHLDTKPGESVVVVGSGPIGIMHAMINRLAGSTNVAIVDINKKRLEEASAFGVADCYINSSEEDLEDAVRKMTDGKGADIVITANSVPELQQSALEIAGVHGRVNFFGGMPKGKEIVNLNTNLIHYKELTVLGTTGSNLEDVEKAIKIVSSDRVDVKGLVSRKFPIEQAAEAFEFALSGQGLKVLIGNE